MKKDKARLIMTIIIIALILIEIVYLYTAFSKKGQKKVSCSSEDNSTGTCIYNETGKNCSYSDPNKSYISKNSTCLINFLCIQGTKGFKDDCGCGCVKSN